jgi:hypothetical protein
MKNLDHLFTDGTLGNYLKKNLTDPWKETNFEGYIFLLPTQKGKFGERLISNYMDNRGSVVQRPVNRGHDRMIDGFKTEIKFGLCNRDDDGELYENKFTINHISKDKDWERLIFFGVNYDFNKSHFIWFKKDDFVNYLETDGKHFCIQQGGKSVENDDYIYSGDITEIIGLDFVRDIEEWFTDTSDIRYNDITKWII